MIVKRAEALGLDWSGAMRDMQAQDWAARIKVRQGSSISRRASISSSGSGRSTTSNSRSSCRSCSIPGVRIGLEGREGMKGRGALSPMSPSRIPWGMRGVWIAWQTGRPRRA